MNAHFTIHGDFITNFFRTLVLEGSWRKAAQDLQDSLIGISTEQTYDVLSGKKQLVGVNQLDFIEDNKFQDETFFNNQYFTYFYNVYLINNKFYKKYHTEYINEFYNFSELKNIHGIDFIPVAETMSEKLYLQHLLARSTVKNNTDIIIPIQDKFHFFTETVVDFPIWLSMDTVKEKLNSKDLTESLHSFHIKILDIELENLRPVEIVSEKHFLEQLYEQTKEVDYEVVKQQIIQQAEKLGGWIELHNKKTNTTYTVPKHPFLKWCLSESPLYNTYEWPAINSQGRKCAGDDPNHTDWFLFTGIDLDLAQEIQHPDIDFFYKQRFAFHEKYTNTNLKPLISGNVKSIKDYKILHINTREEINHISEKCIVVIPNADPLFTNVAHLCAELKCPVITETGGALCHLAIVGREFGLTLYLMTDAMKKLPRGWNASIKYEKEKYDDSFTANIEVSDYPVEYTAQLMKLKLSGLYYK